MALHKDSLLARIYGIYTVKMEDIAPVSLVLMGNTKNTDDIKIEHVFDLKGSLFNREVKGKNHKNTATLKDINLLNLCKEKILLRFSRKDQRAIINELERDGRMLERHNIMDYSLLFAIEKNTEFTRRYGSEKSF